MESRQTVAALLEQAASQDPARVAEAEANLKQCESKPMFHATLFDIFADRSLPTNVRWLAIINFKNGVDRYWKKSAQNPIHIDEKLAVRPQLLDVFDEENPLLAVQYCVAVSRVARWEFPRAWPEFTDVLLARARAIVEDTGVSADRRYIMEHNVLYTLHLFVKSFCQRLLPVDRREFRRIAPIAFAFVAPIYARRIAQFNDALQTKSAESQPLLKSIRMCIKTLRRLVVYGFEKIDETGPIVLEFYTATVAHQAAFYDLFRALPPASRDSADGIVLRKIVLLYGKMYLEFQKYHAVRFILLDCAKPMLAWYWSQIQSEAPKLTSSPIDSDGAPELILEPLLIQGIVLYRNTVKNFFYTTDENNPEDSDVKRCRAVIDGTIMVPDFVSQVAETMMAFYIPLKPKDFAMWEEDPEAWLVEEDSDYWEFDVRRSAMRLLVDLVDQNRAQMVPQLRRLLQQTGLAAPTTEAELYRQEGLYAVLGLCANQLYDEIDFCQWLKAHPCVDSPMGVVKWRVAWLIGKWIPVKFPVEQREYAYTILLELAQPSEPLVVRMEALGSLLRCVDDWDFDASQFAPFLQPSIERITGILGDLTMAESRIRIVNFLSTLVGRMQRDIVPYAASIVRLIPPLWQSAAQENMYQTTILSLVTTLINALGAQSVELQHFVAPLVQHSVDLDNPAHVYLLEDGLELWLALIRHATRLDPSIRELIRCIPSLLQHSTETFKTVLKVVEAYALLDGEAIFREYGLALFNALHDLVSDDTLVVRAIAAGYSTLNVIVQCVSIGTAAPLLTESNLLWTVFTRIVDRKEGSLALIHLAGFVSRVAVHYPALLAEFLASQEPALANTFMDTWIDLYDDVGQVTQRRLYAFSFAVVIATANDGVLKNLPKMVPIWNEIISDTGPSLVYFNDAEDDMPDGFGEIMVAENQRRQKMLSSDPVHKFDIKEVLRQSMAECERLNGPERFQAILAQVEAADLEDLRNQLS
ncbi:hypothetical protein GGI07_001165 [Coemansia sp. Benny D115]|nr:hypothetical protein GGI07_001165 [Coemansia sp. Benny D115]